MRFVFLPLFLAAAAVAQQDSAPAPETSQQPDSREYIVDAGTEIPLRVIKGASTKGSAEGERAYLETAFPIVADGRIAIPAGSFVSGTVTHLQRAGRVKGKAELYVRFDYLILKNGVMRDFRARIGSLEGKEPETLDRKEGVLKGEGRKAQDAMRVGEAAASGASVGAITGTVAGRPGLGSAVGAGAGAAAGLVWAMMTRGPDAGLYSGSTLTMVLDRQLIFTDEELNRPEAAGGLSQGIAPQTQQQRKQLNVPMVGRSTL